MDERQLVRTGISGFDEILLGGIPRGNVILVQGPVGTGKTLMGTGFIYRGITEFDEPGIIVTFEAAPEKLLRDAIGLGWDLEQLLATNKLKIIFTSPESLDKELRSADSLLLETVTEIGARRIFIDSIGLLSTVSIDTERATAKRPGSYRDLLLQTIEGLRRANLTAMFSHEIGAVPELLATSEMAKVLADTVISLTQDPRKRGRRRSIEILKSRGQDFESGEHTLLITGGKGLEIFRRVQAPIRRDLAQPTSTAKRSLIGVDALDGLIGGGIFDGSITMVIGVSGAGKTILGTQILREGILKTGNRGLLVSLDEHPAQIVRNAETLGIDLKSQIDTGGIHIFFDSPQELDIDVHFARIVRTVEEHDIQRMVIDGMTSYSTALEDLRVYRDFIHALVSYSKSRLMTTFFNYENPEVFGMTSYMSDFPVSSIVDNIIMLGLVELGNSIHRSITVVKSRGSKHEFQTREFIIAEGGLTLLDLDNSITLPALPLQSYSSLLSRAPTRTSPYSRVGRSSVPLGLET